MRQRLQEQEMEGRRMKRRLEEQDKANAEKEFEMRVQARVDARLRQAQTEMETRFSAATEPRARPESPHRGVATEGFTVRSGAGAWAEMEESEMRQREETKRKEQENVELRAERQQQAREIQQLRDDMVKMAAMMPPKQPPSGAGVFPTPEKQAGTGDAMSDEQLVKLRTEELAEWAEREENDTKKREWQDLCVVHKVKKSGKSWPTTPSGRKKWCERIATAEVELTNCGLA